MSVYAVYISALCRDYDQMAARIFGKNRRDVFASIANYIAAEAGMETPPGGASRVRNDIASSEIGS